MAGCDNAQRIGTDYVMCFTYEKEKECKGASGRKLRRVCIYCPNYQKYLERKEKENGQAERSGSTCHRLKESNKR